LPLELVGYRREPLETLCYFGTRDTDLPHVIAKASVDAKDFQIIADKVDLREA
jgi:glycerol-3-phosphate dehydrogenase